MSVVNLKSVIWNSIFKHPVLMSFWCGERHHSASLTSYYCLMELAAAASATCWTESSVFDWAFRPNLAFFSLLILKVKLADQNWLEYYNNHGVQWRHSASYPPQSEHLPLHFCIHLGFSCRLWCDMTLHDQGCIFQHFLNLPHSHVVHLSLSAHKMASILWRGQVGGCNRVIYFSCHGNIQ